MTWYTLWKYKYWIAIAVLSFICLGQMAYTNHLAGQLLKADQKQAIAVANAIKPYETAIAEAQADAVAKEKIHNDNLLRAEQNAIDKIKTANNDADRATTHAHSLSKQLAEAKRHLPTASCETKTQYIEIGSDVLEQCVSEYRIMAKAADAERIDKERLDEGWPSD